MGKKSRQNQRFDLMIENFKIENKLTKYDMMEFCFTYILNDYYNKNKGE